MRAKFEVVPAYVRVPVIEVWVLFSCLATSLTHDAVSANQKGVLVKKVNIKNRALLALNFEYIQDVFNHDRRTRTREKGIEK